jgi:hypothetical protein
MGLSSHGTTVSHWLGLNAQAVATSKADGAL